jgi:hypothetical protein
MQNTLDEKFKELDDKNNEFQRMVLGFIETLKV